MPLLLLLLTTAGCGHGLGPVEPGTTGLEGTVTLVGSWPPDTQLVGVALFARPPMPGDLVLPAAFTSVSDTTLDSFDYRFGDVRAGSYDYLVVAWLEKGVGLFDLESWVELAVHEEPVLITPGVVRRIDLVGDFSRVPGGTPGSGGGR
ncbi:MAG: hypothetical protein R6W82_10725 [bacterium]